MSEEKCVCCDARLVDSSSNLLNENPFKDQLDQANKRIKELEEELTKKTVKNDSKSSFKPCAEVVFTPKTT